jgi:hypothetical protein
VQKPSQNKEPAEKAELVTAEVSKLLTKGAIKKVFAVDG